MNRRSFRSQALHVASNEREYEAEFGRMTKILPFRVKKDPIQMFDSKPIELRVPKKVELLSEYETYIPGEDIKGIAPRNVFGVGCLIFDNKGHSVYSGVRRDLNKVITINPIRRFYKPYKGDLVVGVVIDVFEGRWLVDIGASKNAVLKISGIPLPHGIVRLKSRIDVEFMMKFIVPGDVISSEVQQVLKDGTCFIQIRSEMFGRFNGGFSLKLDVQSIPQLGTNVHVWNELGIYTCFGSNGYIFITPLKEGINNLVNKSTDIHDVHAWHDDSLMKKRGYCTQQVHEDMCAIIFLIQLLVRFDILADPSLVRRLIHEIKQFPRNKWVYNETQEQFVKMVRDKYEIVGCSYRP